MPHYKVTFLVPISVEVFCKHDTPGHVHDPDSSAARIDKAYVGTVTAALQLLRPRIAELVPPDTRPIIYSVEEVPNAT